MGATLKHISISLNPSLPPQQTYVSPNSTPVLTLCPILPAAAIWPLVILVSRLSMPRCCINTPTLSNIDEHIHNLPSPKKSSPCEKETTSSRPDSFKFVFTCPKMIIRQLEISVHVPENLLKRVGVHC